MIGKAKQAWAWLVEGLVEAAVWAVERLSRVKRYRLEVDAEHGTLLGPEGAVLARLEPDGATVRIAPADVGARLAGAMLDIVVPAAWQFRRELDPVALQSRPFLDAFVRHQIERITPWRVADTHYRILQQPLAGDPGRLAVAVAVVPKRLVARWLEPFAGLPLRAIRLRTAGAAEDDGIPLVSSQPRLAAPLRQGVTWGLSVMAVGTALAVAWLQWEAAAVRSDIDDQQRVIAERQAVLARAQRLADPGGVAAAQLRALRDSRPLAVAVVDALATAVPDSTHLTALSIAKDHVTISGVTTDPSQLVPALETSGFFADVTFGAATTRTESGIGDRFSLEMKALVPQASFGGAPGAAVATGSLPTTQARAAP